MATRRIVDLSKPLADQAAITEAVKNEQKLDNQSQNCLLLEAREKINDAMEVLFTKDSRLRKLQVPSQASEKKAAPAPMTTNDNATEEIKVGQFKLKGKIRVPNRRVVLNESALAELKRNVMLFSN